MATDSSRDHYSGLLVPDARFTVWEEECVAAVTGAQGAHVGQPVEADSQRSALTLRTLRRERAGTESDVTITTRTAGLPALTGTLVGQSAGFTFERDGATFGWTPPSVLTGWRNLKCTNGAGTDLAARHPHAVVTAANTCLVAYEVERSASRRVLVRRLEQGASEWEAAATVVTGLDDTVPSCPCLLAMPDGRVLLYHWDTYAEGAVRLIYLRAWVSADDGATFTSLADSVIKDPLGIDSPTTPRFEPRQLRAAATPYGQVILLAGVDVSTYSACKSATLQYASVDGGISFTPLDVPLDSTDEGSAYADVVFDGDLFVVAYLEPTTGTPQVSRIGSAFTPFLTGEVVAAGDDDVWNTTTFGASKSIAAAGLALVREESGVLYCYGITDPSSSPTGVTLASYDRGASWERVDGYLGADESWWVALLKSTRPETFAAVAHEGRVILAATHEGAATAGDATADSITALYLGGYETVTAPHVGFPGWEARRVGWRSTYVATFDEADDVGFARSGTPTTEELDTATGALHLAVSGGGAPVTVTYTRTLVATSTIHGVFAGAAGATALAVFEATISDVATYGVRFEISTTNLLVYERAGVSTFTLRDTTTIAPPSRADGTTTATEVKYVILDDGRCKVWWRYATDAAVNAWTLAWSGTLGDIVATVNTGRVQLGALLGFDGDEVWLYTAHYNDGGDDRAQHLYDQTAATMGARPYSLTGTYVVDGIVLVAAGGPALVDEEWSIATAWDYALDRALLVDPRRGWRGPSTATATKIALRLDGLDEGTMPTDVLGIALVDATIAIVGVELYDDGTSSWVSVGDADLTVGPLAWSVAGNTIVPDSSGHVATPLVREAEFDGAAFANTDSGMRWARRIARSTSGKWSGGTSLKPRLMLETTPGGGATTTDGVIIPSRSVVLVSLRGGTFYGVRLTLSSTALSGYFNDTGDWRIGSLVVGSVYVHADDPDWGRSVETEVFEERTGFPDGSVHRRQLGPTVRRVEIPWQDGIDELHSSTDDDDPRWVGLDEDGEPLALIGTTGWTVAGLFEQLAVSRAAVVYLPRVGAFEGGATMQVLNRRHELVYGFVESDTVRHETILGEEGVDEAIRMSTLTVRELR